MELAGRSYILDTGIVPDKPYALDAVHSIRAVKPPPLIILDDENTTAIPRTDVMMALSGPEPYDLYADLVVFHSFLTDRPLSTTEPVYFQCSRTYLFAERTKKALYDDAEIESIDSKGINFDHFPVAINVGMRPVFRYISYRNAFSVFLNLKRKFATKNIRSQNKRLYDQIHLWEYARNFITTSRIYSNDYFPVALSMTILESLIGRPKKCTYHAKCPVCKNRIDHDAVTWSKHFRINNIRRIPSHNIKIISTIRNEVYHNGNLFDLFEEFDKVMGIRAEQANKKDRDHLDNVQSIQDDIIQISRRKLLHEFLRQCSNAK